MVLLGSNAEVQSKSLVVVVVMMMTNLVQARRCKMLICQLLAKMSRALFPTGVKLTGTNKELRVFDTLINN